MLIRTDGGAILAIQVDTLGWRMSVLLLMMMMICRFFDALSRLNVLLLAVDSVNRTILLIQFFAVLLLICRKGYSRNPDSLPVPVCVD
jgi:hypothetical protein